MKYGIDGLLPLLLEYEAELPPFPEGYKIKQEAMMTVSTAPPEPSMKSSQMRTVLIAGGCHTVP